MTQQQELYNSALESGGALEEASSIKAESIEGKINTLNNTVKQMWTNFINSDTVKGLVDLVTDLVSVLGNIPMVVTLATTALLLFKGKAILGGISAISGYITSLISLATTEGVVATATTELSFAFDKLKVAFASNPLGLIALGVTAVIGSLYMLDKKAEETKQEVKDMASDIASSMSQYNQTKTSNDNLSNLVSKQEALKQAMETSSGTAEELKQKKQELLEVEKQIAQILPESATGYDKENNALSDNVELNKQLVEAKKAQQEADLRDNVKKADDKVAKANDEYKKAKARLDNLENEKKTNENNIEELKKNGGSQDEINAQTKNISAINQAMIEERSGLASIKAGLLEANVVYQEFNKTVGDASGEHKDLIDLSDYVIDKYLKETDSVDKLSKAQEKLNKAKAEAKDYDQEASFNSAKEDFTKSIEEIDKIQKIINEFGNSKKVDDNTLKSAIELYPELYSHINDTAYIIDYLNKKIKEQGETQKQAYQNMMMNDTEYFNSSIKNSDNWKNFVENSYKQLIDSNDDYYKKLGDKLKEDLSNCTTAQEAKITMENYTTQIMLEAWAKYYETLNKMQSEHMNMVKNEAGELVENKKGMAKDADGNDMVVLEDTTGRGNVSGVGLKEANNKLQEGYDRVNKMKEDYNKAIEKLKQDAQNTINSFGGGIGSNITDNKESSSSTAKDYSVKNVEDLTDVYHDLNNALDLTSSKLKLLQERYENLYGKAKANAMREQVDILKQQANLYSQMESKMNSELAKQRAELSAKGVQFDSSGMISNYNQLLTSLRNNANAINTVDEASQKAKQNSIENLKSLKTEMDNYNTTIVKNLQEQKEKWQEVQNQIKEIYKTMQQMVADGESKVTDVIKHELDKRKEAQLKSIEEVKKALQDQWDIDDYADQLAEAQDKVQEYEEKIANAIKMGDINSLTSLKKEQQDAIKELNDLQKQHERDSVNKELDDQTDAINKKYEEMEKSQNLTKMVTDALQTGFINIDGEVIRLSDSMNTFVQDTTVGLTNINTVAREMNENFANAIAMLQQMGGYSGVNNLLPDVPYQLLLHSNGYIDGGTILYDKRRQLSNTNINLGGIVVNGNLDNVTLEDVNTTITKRLRDVIGNNIS